MDVFKRVFGKSKKIDNEDIVFQEPIDGFEEKIQNMTDDQKNKLIEKLALREFDNESDITYDDATEWDEYFEDAARIIVQIQQGSTSLLPRRLQLGYNRAGRIIDQLEAAGIVGPFEGDKARKVNVKDEASLEQLLKDITSGYSSQSFYDKFYEIHQREIEIQKRAYERRLADIEEQRTKDEIKQKLLEKEKRKRLEKEALQELIEEGEIFSARSESESNREPISKDVMDRVWNRDGGKCVRCGSQENLEFDHIIPVSKGGATTYRNLQLLCQKCNREKSNNIG